jgi:O-antigen biosynthesis protein WbqP
MIWEHAMYKKLVKRLLDIVLSLAGLIVSAIPMAVITLVIKREDPGPAVFKQKRFGIHKSFFTLYKFRSMKLSTPHDVPTHQLEDPEQYLLKSGKIIRKYSLDELPQLLNIFKGDMSVIGPRPALWNQDDLIEERDKYGANDVKPGLTGWAQINGRDELEIPVKAKLDGEYAKKLSFIFDCRCFFGTFLKVLRHEGVVEGGTGELAKTGKEK